MAKYLEQILPEHKLLELIAEGRTFREIALRLSVKYEHVKRRVEEIGVPEWRVGISNEDLESLLDIYEMSGSISYAKRMMGWTSWYKAADVCKHYERARSHLDNIRNYKRDKGKSKKTAVDDVMAEFMEEEFGLEHKKPPSRYKPPAVEKVHEEEVISDEDFNELFGLKEKDEDVEFYTGICRE